MATEGLKKHSTTLFSGVLASQQTKWSGLLEAHKNLNNHQICIVADGVVTSGGFTIYIIPDSDDANTAVNTGLALDMTGKDSALVTFTGVIRGLYIESAGTPVTPSTVQISAVISSFSRYHRPVKGNVRDALDYVTTPLTSSLLSGFADKAYSAPNHSNLIYHQLTLTADQAIDDQYAVRFAPESEYDLETTVDSGFVADFNGTTSALVRFGGVISGVHLQKISGTSSNVPLQVVLSSAVERFDELVYEYIGVAPELGDHLTDYNNPHQTSWDNILNKPIYVDGYPIIHEILDTGVSLEIPTDYQFIVWEAFNVYGSLTVNGKMIILHDRPETRAKEPDFTYNGSGQLTQIDYAAGEQKLFSYNGSGQLIQVDSIRLGTTLRKDFTYTGGGELDYITESWV